MAHRQRGVKMRLLADSEETLRATWWLMLETVVIDPAASGASLRPD